MKKKLSFILCLLMLFYLLPLQAQAVTRKLEVVSQNIVIEEKEDGVNVYAFARIKNLSSSRLQYDSGRFDVYGKDGDLLGFDKYPAVYAAKFMKPGEYGYVKACVSLEGVTAEEVGKCKLKIEKGNTYKGRAYIKRYKCKASYEKNVEYGGFITYDYMGATVKNNTKKILYDMEAVFALCSKDGTILNIGYASMGFLNDIGLHPGSTVTMRDVNSGSMKKAYEKAGYSYSYVDAIVYREIYV